MNPEEIEQNINEQNQVEIDEETLERLVKEIIENPSQYPTEAKLILTVEEWERQGPSFDDYQRLNVIQGEVREITLEAWDEGYPYRRGYKVALIPLAIPTIIEVERYSDTTEPVQSMKFVYIFTKEGWKSIRVY